MNRSLTGLFLATLMVLAAPSVFAHPDARHSLEVIDAHLVAAPNDPQLHLTKATILLGIEHVAEAVKCVDEAARLNPDAPGIGYVEARLFAAAGNPGAARHRLDAFLKTEPQHTDALRLASRLAADAGDMEEAIARSHVLLQGTEKPMPDDVSRGAVLYLHRHQPGDDDHALSVIDTGLARLGCLTGLQLMACDIEVRLARHDAALSRMAALTARFGPRVEFELKRADIFTLAHRLSEAAQAYDNAVAIMDSYPRERQTAAVFQQARQKFTGLRDELRQKSAE